MDNNHEQEALLEKGEDNNDQTSLGIVNTALFLAVQVTALVAMDIGHAAVLSLPGRVRPDDSEGHKGGNLIVSANDAARKTGSSSEGNSSVTPVIASKLKILHFLGKRSSSGCQANTASEVNSILTFRWEASSRFPSAAATFVTEYGIATLDDSNTASSRHTRELCYQLIFGNEKIEVSWGDYYFHEKVTYLGEGFELTFIEFIIWPPCIQTTLEWTLYVPSAGTDYIAGNLNQQTEYMVDLVCSIGWNRSYHRQPQPTSNNAMDILRLLTGGYSRMYDRDNVISYDNTKIRFRQSYDEGMTSQWSHPASVLCKSTDSIVLGPKFLVVLNIAGSILYLTFSITHHMTRKRRVLHHNKSIFAYIRSLASSWKYRQSKLSVERNRNNKQAAFSKNKKDNYHQTSREDKIVGDDHGTAVSNVLLVVSPDAAMTYQAEESPPGSSRYLSAKHATRKSDPATTEDGSSMVVIISNNRNPIWNHTIGTLNLLISSIVSNHEKNIASDPAAVLLEFRYLITLVLTFIITMIISTSTYITLYFANDRTHRMTTRDEDTIVGDKSMSTCASESDPAAADEDDPNTMPSGNTREPRWNVASGAVHHMTGNLSLLFTGGYSPMTKDEDLVVHAANTGEPLRVRGSGSVRTDTITLDDVWYVPGLLSNLVSTGQLARLGCAIDLGPSGCRITRGDALVGSARFADGYLFELDFLDVASSK